MYKNNNQKLKFYKYHLQSEKNYKALRNKSDQSGARPEH